MTNPWRLTKRKAEVLDVLVEEGESNHDIGERLGVGHKTVEKHFREIFGVMGARGRVDAALMWDRWKRAQEVAQ